MKFLIKKMVIALAFLGSFDCYAFTNLEMPEQFIITQKLLSWTSTFDIESKQFKLGKVQRRFFSLSIQYDFYDCFEQLRSTGRLRWLSWGNVFDVTDAQERLIGTVEERVLNFFPTFDIISPFGEKLATATINFWGTQYILKDPVTEQEMATLSRPFLSFQPNWTIDVINPELFALKNIPPELFILIAVFQTDREYWNSQNALSYSNPSHIQ